MNFSDSFKSSTEDNTGAISYLPGNGPITAAGCWPTDWVLVSSVTPITDSFTQFSPGKACLEFCSVGNRFLGLFVMAPLLFVRLKLSVSSPKTCVHYCEWIRSSFWSFCLGLRLFSVHTDVPPGLLNTQRSPAETPSTGHVQKCSLHCTRASFTPPEQICDITLVLWSSKTNLQISSHVSIGQTL